MAAILAADSIHTQRLMRAADWLAVAVAASLPWSTSATSILLVLWLIALIPTLDWDDVRREAMTLAGGLPVALVALGALGMLWADVSWIERWKGLDSFLKLLAIPLFLAQFRRSERGLWVFSGYLVACAVLLLATFVLLTWLGLGGQRAQLTGVLVKNAATQSGEFVICIFGLLFVAIGMLRRSLFLVPVGLLLLALLFLGNILYVATGRTALVVIPILLVLLVIKTLNARATLLLLLGAVLISGAAWTSSEYLRDRITTAWTDLDPAPDREINSSTERIEFARKSIGFIAQAPILGHGTGSMTQLFRQSAQGQTGVAARVTTNPHNQTFAVAIQLGLVGVVLLWAMWIVHLLMFRGNGLAEWIGLVIVVQSIVGSVFNSHLFDFVQGWMYVVGVGVAGGMALKNKRAGP